MHIHVCGIWCLNKLMRWLLAWYISIYIYMIYIYIYLSITYCYLIWLDGVWILVSSQFRRSQVIRRFRQTCTPNNRCAYEPVTVKVNQVWLTSSFFRMTSLRTGWRMWQTISKILDAQHIQIARWETRWRDLQTDVLWFWYILVLVVWSILVLLL